MATRARPGLGWRRLGAVLPRRRARRVAIALGPDRVVAVRLRRTVRGLGTQTLGERELEPWTAEGEWHDLATALTELGQAFDLSSATVDVALARPLCEAKVLALPPVRARELRPLLQRNARRYFVHAPERPRVDAIRLAGGGRGRPRPVLAMCAAEPVLEAVRRAIAAAGLAPGTIAPGSVGVAAAVTRWLPASRRGDVVIACESAGWRELVHLRGGRPVLLQPLPGPAAAPGGEPDPDAAAALERARNLGLNARRVLICAPAASAERWLALIGPGGSAPAPRPLGRSRLGDAGPDALAAAGASLLRHRPLLGPDEVHARVRRGRLRRRMACAVVTVVLACAAAGAHLWGLTGQLRAVQERRQIVAPAVADVLQARRTLDGLREVLVALDALEQAATPWAGALHALSSGLPDSAYLRSIVGDSSGLRVTGTAASIAEVVPALEASPAFAKVGLGAPVRRDAVSGAETFQLVMAVRVPPVEAPAEDS